MVREFLWCFGIGSDFRVVKVSKIFLRLPVHRGEETIANSSIFSSGGPQFGWVNPLCGVMLTAGVLSIAGFCYIETVVEDPILPMSIFKSAAFTAVSISLCLGWMSFGMFEFYAPHLYAPTYELAEGNMSNISTV